MNTRQPRPPRLTMPDQIKAAYIGAVATILGPVIAAVIAAILMVLLPKFTVPHTAPSQRTDTPCAQQATNKTHITHKARKTEQDKTPTVRHNAK